MPSTAWLEKPRREPGFPETTQRKNVIPYVGIGHPMPQAHLLLAGTEVTVRRQGDEIVVEVPAFREFEVVFVENVS